MAVTDASSNLDVGGDVQPISIINSSRQARRETGQESTVFTERGNPSCEFHFIVMIVPTSIPITFAVYIASKQLFAESSDLDR